MPQDRRQLRTTTSISAVFSGKQLDFRTARPSKILATNSETVGFQDHSLRQAVRAKRSLWARGRAEKPNNGGPSRANLRTPMAGPTLEIRSLRRSFSKSQD